MKKYLSVFILLTVFGHPLFSQDWVQKASMPTAGRYAAIAFVVNNNAYVGLGVNASQQKYHDIWEYDMAANSWTQKVDYPGNGMYAATAFSINGKGYICLGGDATSNTNGTNQLWEYDPTNDSWLQKASFPGIGRYGASCFVIGDTAFVGTGSYCNPNDYLSDFWMYIPASDTWTQLPNYPGSHRNHGNSFVIQNTGYLGTGLVNNSVVTNDFWGYNKNSNTWTNIAPLLGQDRMGTASFVFLDKGYVGTGKTINQVYYNTFYEYSPGTNTWSLISTNGALPARSGAITFYKAGVAYIATGQNSSGALSDLWSWKIQVTGVDDEMANNVKTAFRIYTNPTASELFIESKGNEAVRFEIFNSIGQVQYKGSFTKLTTVQTDRFASGVYFIKFDNGKTTECKKIIIN